MAVVNHAVAVLWAIAALGTVSAPAASQEVNPLVRERLMVVQGPSDRRTDQIRVQVGINFFVPGPTNDGGDASKLREHARRAIYVMAGRECGLLLDTIAAECRLDSITVNLSRQGGQVEGFNAMGQLGFRIRPK